MQVALYARVSTSTQQQDGTIVSQVRSLKQYIHERGWSLGIGKFLRRKAVLSTNRFDFCSGACG
jgi:DNA invertase Pin-like site-specific DNA recombinase